MSRKDSDNTVEAPSSGIVTFTTSKGAGEYARKLEVSFDFGDNTAQAVEKFGEEAVFANFIRGARVALQGNIRAKLSLTGEDAKTDDEILTEAADWKPGTKSARGTSKTSKIQKLLDAMGDEEKEAFLAQVAEMQATVA